MSSLIQQARAALKAGDKAGARGLLEQAVEQDPRDHVAWLLLAGAAPAPHTALAYAQRAAHLRPADPTVKKALAWAQAQAQAAEQAQKSAHRPAPTAVPPPRATRTWLRPTLVILLLALLLAVGVYGWQALNGAPLTLLANSAPAVPTQVVTAVPVQFQQDAPTEEPAVVATAVSPSATPTATPPRLHAKNVAKSSPHEPRPTWTLTPTPTDTPVPTPTLAPTATAEPASAAAGRPAGVGANERWIDVNLTTQTLVAYEGDTPMLNVLISSGTWQFPTVTGQFRTYMKYESQTMNGYLLGYDYYLENVPYVMYFYNDYAIHGTFWHNNFGTPMSHGCVNVNTADAGWLFNWAPLGTLVNVHY